MKVSTYWGHSFLLDLVRDGGLVFDFGVNSGGFSKLLAPRCRKVIGFEPDPVWRGRLQLPSNVQLVEKALAARRGVLRLNVNTDKCSSLHYADSDASSVEVETITLADALAMEPEGRIDLIKMDIEGEEIAVLLCADAALFDRVAQMTIEFHDFLDPASTPQIRSVIARMESLGFTALKMSWRSYGDLVFLNRKLVPLGIGQLAWILFWQKYVSGFFRVITRPMKNALGPRMKPAAKA